MRDIRKVVQRYLVDKYNVTRERYDELISHSGEPEHPLDTLNFGLLKVSRKYHSKKSPRKE